VQARRDRHAAHAGRPVIANKVPHQLLVVFWRAQFLCRVDLGLRPYCKAFSAWIAKHGFNGIEKTVRSAALDLVEHLAEIEAWRLTLSEKRRRQLKHPLSNVAAWRKAPQQAADPLIRDDPVEAAKAAWQRFCVIAGG
jgi:hypothetical protein